jgi:transcriptional regulator with XRE-family HTH domain
MMSQEAILTRRRIMGVLLRDARLRAKKSVEEVAQALSCDPDLIAQAEEGQNGLTLPQVECLAHLYQVPLSHFLGEGELLEDKEDPDLLPYQDIILLRRKIIGVMLRQARLEAGRALEEAATVLDYGPEYLARIELGEEEIDLIELQVLAEALGIAFENLVSEDLVPSSADERGRHDLGSLAHLPAEVQEFVANSINLPYLQVAMNLSQMPVETLRQIATGLLEITY